MSYKDMVEAVRADASASRALKETLSRYDEKDIVDAINDLEFLTMLFNVKLREVVWKL